MIEFDTTAADASGPPREADIEGRVTAWAKRRGWASWKWVSPSNRGVPDRLYFRSRKACPACGRAFQVRIVEFKAPGKHPTKLQAFVHATLRAAGVPVHVVDSVEGGRRALA